MRQYKYNAILVSLNQVTKKDEFSFLYPVYGINKKNAIDNINLDFPFRVESCKRVNVTDRKREKQYSSFACIDMAQCSKD